MLTSPHALCIYQVLLSQERPDLIDAGFVECSQCEAYDVVPLVKPVSIRDQLRYRYQILVRSDYCELALVLVAGFCFSFSKGAFFFGLCLLSPLLYLLHCLSLFLL